MFWNQRTILYFDPPSPVIIWNAFWGPGGHRSRNLYPQVHSLITRVGISNPFASLIGRGNIWGYPAFGQRASRRGGGVAPAGYKASLSIFRLSWFFPEGVFLGAIPRKYPRVCPHGFILNHWCQLDHGDGHDE